MNFLNRSLIAFAALLGMTSCVIADESAVPLASSLKAHVLELTSTPEPRNYEHMDSLNATADYVEAALKKAGIATTRQEYEALDKRFFNIVGKIETDRPQTIILGAHYDVWGPGPGADDNASGVAGLIELARLLQANKEKLAYNVEIVAFTNEEPPFFRTQDMGSYVHARSIRDRKEAIAYIVVLEMIGFYSEKPESQRYPLPAMRETFPTTGNFIAVVGNTDSSGPAAYIKQAILKNASIDCQCLIAPPTLTGVDFSDHLNYWAIGMKAVMITDTSFFRNPNYHVATDTADTLDYDKMAQVINGLAAAFYTSP